MLFRPSTFSPLARSARAFSSTPSRAYDLCKVTLIGHIVREPEVKSSKSEKEYMIYTVATQQYPPPPLSADGTRIPARTTFHRVLTFQPGSYPLLRSLSKGTRVLVEASMDVREPVPDAEPGTFDSQRHIMLRHEFLRVINRPINYGSKGGDSQDSEN